ncbi:MAG: hypothetical protein ACRDB0_03135, partial [Paraclostridium sp.]
MLKDSIDFEYAIKKVKEKIELDIQQQGKTLDSEKMNLTLDNIEFSLNKLYENSRYLEDAIEYCKTFLAIKIDDYTSDIKATLKSIEDIRDINKNMAYMETPIVFKENKDILSDRDGSSIASSIVKNDKLILGNKTEINIDYKDCTRRSDSVPYDENIANIKTEPYRAIYIEEKVVSGGLKETITITLKTPSELNYLDIKTVNADIKNLRYVYVNGVEDYIDYNTGVTTNKIVASIKFDLVCSKYNQSTYYLNKNKLADNTWNKIKEYEYNYVTGVNSKVDAEALIARISKKYNANTEESILYNDDIPDKENILDKTMFTYMFGIDSIEIKSVEQETQSCFISELIDIGVLKENEYIQLNTNQFNDENCSVEYSIMDGDVDVPIMPIGTKHIENERIFKTLSTRFDMSESSYTVIKRNGVVANISLEDAKNQIDGIYSMDYIPGLKYNYTPINNTIRIKATIRRFGTVQTNPYI